MQKVVLMLKRSSMVLGLVLSIGMALGFADGAPAAGASDKNAAEKNAISTDAKEHCDKSKADCPKAADCPKGAECPKDKHCPKGSQCHKKHGEVKAKAALPAGSTVAPAEKPAEAGKETVPATH